MMMDTKRASEAMKAQLIGENIDFMAVSTDTRKLAANSLFFALKGDNFNGEDYLDEAKNAGVAAAVVSRHHAHINLPQLVVDDVCLALGQLATYWRKMLSAKVCAITGSCGKTTVKGMLQNVLSHCGKTHATPGNFNNHIGVPLTVLSAPEDCEYLVAEVGTSSPGEIAYLRDIIIPDVTVVINVQPAHVEGFGSLDAIASEKSTIYDGSCARATAVINVNLLGYDAIKAIVDHHGNATFFAEEKPLDECLPEITCFAKNITMNQGCARFDLHVDGVSSHVKLNVFGRHQVENTLAAAACASAMGASIDAIKHGVEGYRSVAGRMQKIDLKHMTVIDDSYNANPGSMRAAIDFLSDFDPSVLVVGDMGELGSHVADFHREIGEYAREKKITRLAAVGDFAQDYVDGFQGEAHIFSDHDALTQFLQALHDQSTVLIKGSRSSAMERICRGLLDSGEHS